MCLDLYQKNAHKFATYGNNPMYPLLGLAEEAGEVLGKCAKYIRKHDGAEPITGDVLHCESKLTELEVKDTIEFRDALKKELGDVMWMVAEIATMFNMSLSNICEENITKLTDRKKRNVIIGEGDDR
jgi:NTP pyrophosphatase (non-canonical NTP hydrolase)